MQILPTQMRRSRSRSVTAALLLCLIAWAGSVGSSVAQSNPSGLDLPRFVSTRSQPINVRVGPGTKYDVVWIFNMSGLPVEVIQEFDVWRKIRYVDGEEGWIHQNLLTARRSGIVQAFGGNGRTAIYAEPDESAPVRAWVESGFLLEISACEDAWCAVSAPGTDAHPGVSGYMVQFELWGVYPDETFN